MLVFLTFTLFGRQSFQEAQLRPLGSSQRFVCIVMLHKKLILGGLGDDNAPPSLVAAQALV